MTEKRLYRSRADRVVAGVLGGVAHYFGWDPSLVRIAFVVLAIFPGSLLGGLLVYVIAAFVIPEEPVAAGPVAEPRPAP